NFSQFELAINNGNSSSAGLILKLSNVTVEAGDVIAPHLYDWVFDGVDDYVESLDYLYLYDKRAIAIWF
ncbi:hypothetical protein apy_15750, partial [Aeropyrum pernix]